VKAARETFEEAVRIKRKAIEDASKLKVADEASLAAKEQEARQKVDDVLFVTEAGSLKTDVSHFLIRLTGTWRRLFTCLGNFASLAQIDGVGSREQCGR